MGYSHAVRQSVLKKVLPPECRSIRGLRDVPEIMNLQ